MGYAVLAGDGFAGTVGAMRDEPAGAYLIVLGGPWNNGRALMVPAGMVKHIEARVVHLGCSLRELRDAPAYENDRYQDAAYRGELTAYYARLARGTLLPAIAAALRSGRRSLAPAAFGGRLAG